MNTKKCSRGFSLIELLTVLLICICLTVLVLPGISGVVSRSRETSAHYNAQSIANAYTAARAYGINLPKDKLEVIKKLRGGIKTSNGTYIRVTFPAEYDSMVAGYLQISDSSGEMFLRGVPLSR